MEAFVVAFICGPMDLYVFFVLYVFCYVQEEDVLLHGPESDDTIRYDYVSGHDDTMRYDYDFNFGETIRCDTVTFETWARRYDTTRLKFENSLAGQTMMMRPLQYRYPILGCSVSIFVIGHTMTLPVRDMVLI